MSAKAISELTGKEFLYKFISTKATVQNKFKNATVRPETDWGLLVQQHPWLQTEVSSLHGVVPGLNDAVVILVMLMAHKSSGVSCKYATIMWLCMSVSFNWISNSIHICNSDMIMYHKSW